MREERPIYRIRHGSHLYGTNNEDSDQDYKAVYIPSGRSILLQRIKEGRASGPVKEANEKNKPGDIDTQSFAVSKLFRMISMGDIIGCELIFTPDEHVIYKHPLYEAVLDSKKIFLSKKVDGYVGYCRQQANKYGIRGSRIAATRGLLELLKGFPGNKKLNEFIEPLTEYLTRTEHCSMTPINNTGTDQWMDHVECCSKKVPVTNTVHQAILVFQRYFDEYGHRALLAEKNEGIDWKALSHAVRVANQAIELLETHQITFPRPEARRLLDIKTGKVPYREVADSLDELLGAVMAASAASTLPDKPDQEAIDELTLWFHGLMVK